MKVGGGLPAAQIPIRSDCVESEHLRKHLDSLPNADTTALQPIDPLTDSICRHPDLAGNGAPRLTRIAKEVSENGTVDIIEFFAKWFDWLNAEEGLPRASSSDRAYP
jgi:hypothetical protein